MSKESFDWHPVKDGGNRHRALHAFADPHRVIAKDIAHSDAEPRFYCFGMVDGAVMTVRFTWRDGMIRIIGAGYRRQGGYIHEHENPVHG